ncbi:MAG: LamG domain-containing protein [Nitrospirae bacterium]|nr:LamG domain-containing protein [Nitrospirota bacterium]
MRFLFPILLATILVSAVTPLVQAQDPSLILYFPFDEGSGSVATDFSQYGNDGILNGDAQWVDGKFGGALQFNGTTDWVEVPHADILTVAEEVTVMAWINTPRHTGGPDDAQWQGILAKGNAQRSYSLYTDQGNSGLHFSVGGSGSNSEVEVALNEWQHVVGQVVGGNTHRYYINGELAGDFPGQNPPPGLADTENVLIGKTHENSREFDGLIDEVRIWNRALSEEEIQNYMNTGNVTAVEPAGKLATAWGALKSR